MCVLDPVWQTFLLLQCARDLLEDSICYKNVFDKSKSHVEGQSRILRERVVSVYLTVIFTQLGIDRIGRWWRRGRNRIENTVFLGKMSFEKVFVAERSFTEMAIGFRNTTSWRHRTGLVGHSEKAKTMLVDQWGRGMHITDRFGLICLRLLIDLISSFIMLVDGATWNGRSSWMIIIS